MLIIGSLLIALEKYEHINMKSSVAILFYKTDDLCFLVPVQQRYTGTDIGGAVVVVDHAFTIPMKQLHIAP